MLATIYGRMLMREECHMTGPPRSDIPVNPKAAASLTYQDSDLGGPS